MYRYTKVIKKKSEFQWYGMTGCIANASSFFLFGLFLRTNTSTVLPVKRKKKLACRFFSYISPFMWKSGNSFYVWIFFPSISAQGNKEIHLLEKDRKTVIFFSLSRSSHTHRKKNRKHATWIHISCHNRPIAFQLSTRWLSWVPRSFVVFVFKKLHNKQY